MRQIITNESGSEIIVALIAYRVGLVFICSPAYLFRLDYILLALYGTDKGRHINWRRFLDDFVFQADTTVAVNLRHYAEQRLCSRPAAMCAQKLTAAAAAAAKLFAPNCIISRSRRLFDDIATKRSADHQHCHRHFIFMPLPSQMVEVLCFRVVCPSVSLWTR